MVGTVASFLIFEVHPFEVVSILVFVSTVTMLQPVLKPSLEEELSIAIYLTCSLEN